MAFPMFPVLIEAMWAALIACKNTSSSEAECFFVPSTIFPETRTQQELMFLHDADSLHSTERKSSDVWWFLADWENKRVVAWLLGLSVLSVV